MGMPPGSMSGGGGDSMSSTMMMHMSLYWGKDAVIWFPRWPEHSLGMYVLALLCVFLVAAAAELLSVLPAFGPGVGRSAVALSQAGVHAIRMGLAYLVMLAVMSFNIGMFLAAVVGHAVGFFVVRCRSPPAGGGTQDDLHSGCVTTPKV